MIAPCPSNISDTQTYPPPSRATFVQSFSWCLTHYCRPSLQYCAPVACSTFAKHISVISSAINIIITMHSKVLLTSTFLVASVFADGHGSDKSSWDGGDMSWGAPSSDQQCCNGGSWNDWQTGAPPASASAPGELIVQIVSVSDANGSLKYYPDNIQAAPGSVVQFQFHPKNHTITESSFAEPCKPIAPNLTSPTRPGLKSGFVPVMGTESTTPVYNVLINDTKPIWLYCGQGPHCQKGMSMVINQNMSSTDKTIEAYKAAAAKIPLPPSPNATAPGSSPYGAPPVAPAPSVVAAPPSPGIGVQTSTSTTFAGGLPAPTSPVSPITTTSAVAPSVFTGAASRQDAINVGSFGGLLVAGLAALL